MNGIYAYFLCHYIFEQFQLLRQDIFIIEASIACCLNRPLEACSYFCACILMSLILQNFNNTEKIYL